MIKVLYLSYDGLTDPLGQSQILPYLCGLSSEYAITIVSFEKKKRYKIEKKLIEGICKKNSILWVPLVYHKNPPVISTLYDLWRLRRISAMLHRNQNFKIIHCRSYLTSLVGQWMKNSYGTKFLFDMRGFWADERVDGGLWNLKNPFYKMIYNFFKKKEADFINHADYIISLTENAKEEISRWNNEVKIEVIPCCVDLELFDPGKTLLQKKESLRKSLGIGSSDFVLLYLGSLGTWYMLKEMLDFFEELKKTKRDSKFLVITYDHVDITGYQYKLDVIFCNAKRHDVPLYVSLTSCALVFIKPAFSKKASSATKTAEILAMGIPVISNTGWGDVSYYETKIPGCYTVSGLEQYQEAISKLDERLSPEDIRDISSQYFSLSNGIKRYKAVYSLLR